MGDKEAGGWQGPAWNLAPQLHVLDAGEEEVEALRAVRVGVQLHQTLGMGRGLAVAQSG